MFAYIYFLFLFYSFDWRPYKEPLPRCQSLNLRFFFLLTQLFSDKFYNKKRRRVVALLGFFSIQQTSKMDVADCSKPMGKWNQSFVATDAYNFYSTKISRHIFCIKASISSSTKSLIISYIDNDTLNISFSYNIISFLYP